MCSIHEELCNMCVGTLIIWCVPNCDIMLSIIFPSKVDLSFQCHLLDLALKSPFAMAIKELLCTILLTNLIRSFYTKFQSRLEIGWEMYKEIKLQIFILKLIHPCKY